VSGVCWVVSALVVVIVVVEGVLFTDDLVTLWKFGLAGGFVLAVVSQDVRSL